MKKLLGTILLVLAGLLFLQVFLSYLLWSATLAVSFIRPVLITGACIIVMLIGIYMRGDK